MRSIYFSAYQIGTTVRLEAALTDAEGEPANAATMRCRVRKRDSTSETEVTLTSNGGTGLVKGDVTPATPGVYHYRFWMPGSPAVASEGMFEVVASEFAADPA